MNFKENRLKIAVLIIVILIILAGIFVFIQIGPYDKNNKKDVIIDVPSGASVGKISDILYENKLIKNELLFKLLVKVSNKAPSIKSGTYLLNQSYSNNDIISLLVSGKIYQDGIKVTIPEGATSKEIIAMLVSKNLGDKATFENLIKKPQEFYDKFPYLKEDGITSLEGFLYPETYYFNSKKQSEEDILSEMLKVFDSKYTDKFKKKQKELNMTLQEVMEMASIIEKEAVLDKDRPIIASVFYNRLKVGMPLQSDATIQYIFEERKKIVTYDDLKIDSPYNSYKNKGLPPTPISNPGIKSIEAALYPEKTDYLYFVAKIDGGNNYSTNYQDHLKYVKEYKEARDKQSKDTKTTNKENTKK
ncbi:putative aminodeoxychorismate lyase [Clostridioides difficile]|uniref:endolytic transglycosylase MltG n=1 Tax=Clostridioides difficile TaxID=1496 RepID=UPI0003B287E4|nr:endolytic transglycosylase MltG [Clostridioides difficile]CCL10618.1 Putative aminodeoxychorismate lyase [Clostridioides difficile E16]CCL95167.1 Putative aminodeoxychorismate lyase [Clostridioides difficile T61]SJN65798.1 putative aminodeoxychorismate lyase [Clostridioides difficile]SJN77655.1 putative aminodeoxychorismate lyase [Clostridioides difficile]SJO32695.1 putative aminodeoxychorismate lyase [Clostridioides difficile]